MLKKGFNSFLVLKDGWADLISSMVTNDLEAEIRLIKKKKETLLSLLHSGKISQNTFDLLDKNTSRLASAVASLKETLDEEESFWMSNDSQKTKVLETFLIDLKVHYLLGDVSAEEWKQKSEIISSGLNSFRGIETLTEKINSKPAPPTQLLDKDNLSEVKTDLEIGESRELSEMPIKEEKNLKPKKPAKDKRLKAKHKKRITKEPPTLDEPIFSEVHCMNPWKPQCRKTDVELTIYYKGQPTPICHKCWEEISKKDIEWSGL